jgi:hypothetical protein
MFRYKEIVYIVIIFLEHSSQLQDMRLQGLSHVGPWEGCLQRATGRPVARSSGVKRMQHQGCFVVAPNASTAQRRLLHYFRHVLKQALPPPPQVLPTASAAAVTTTIAATTAVTVLNSKLLVLVS